MLNRKDCKAELFIRENRPYCLLRHWIWQRVSVLTCGEHAQWRSNQSLTHVEVFVSFQLRQQLTAHPTKHHYGPLERQPRWVHQPCAYPLNLCCLQATSIAWIRPLFFGCLMTYLVPDACDGDKFFFYARLSQISYKTAFHKCTWFRYNRKSACSAMHLLNDFFRAEPNTIHCLHNSLMHTDTLTHITASYTVHIRELFLD